jgi:hypothetical protein
MKNIDRPKHVFFALLLSFLVFSVTNCLCSAQSENLILEFEQRWDTYGIGGTCIGGSHNIAVANLDGQGLTEIVTGGSSHNLLADGSRTASWAPLKIWNWDGQNVALIKNHSWTGRIGCVYAGDANGDGRSELITAGSMVNDTGEYPSLRIWSWDGENLQLKGNYEGKTVGAISIGDIDGDKKPEIVTVTGRATGIAEAAAQLSIFKWDDAGVVLTSSVDSSDIKEARTHSVYTSDLNNDGLIEIVTAGYGNALNNSKGQLRIWQFDGTVLSMKDSVEWCILEGIHSVDAAGNVMGNTVVHNVKVSDVDDDGFPEIVTGGFTYDGNNVMGQLRIWNWTGGSLSLEKSHEWTNLDITQVSSVSINDVAGDGGLEIVTSGGTGGYGSFAVNAPDKPRAELRVWSWNGSILSLRQSKDWIVDEGVSAWNVGTGDVDNDGRVEIITVGCSYFEVCRDPNLRVWSVPSAAEPTAFQCPTAVMVGIVAGVIAVSAVALTIVWKRRR